MSEGPINQNRVRGKLDLPIELDSKRYACKWVKKGVQVQKAGQKQQVIGTQFVADGWTPWKSKSGQYHARSLTDGQYILCVRPKVLQEALQRIAGNVSRDRMEYEIKGQTIAGEANEDTGMLPHDVLARIPGLGREDMETPKFPQNSIVTETTGASSAKVSTKTKIRKS